MRPRSRSQERLTSLTSAFSAFVRERQPLSAKLTVDGIRVGRTWADVGGSGSVGPASAEQSWEMYE
jgi:hypothetical protein